MSDREFLFWLAQRMINVYGESSQTDFVTRLWGIAQRLDNNVKTVTYGEVKFG